MSRVTKFQTKCAKSPDLPDVWQARAMVKWLEDEAREVNESTPCQEDRRGAIIYSIWENSTPIRGLRVLRFRIEWSFTQALVDQVVGNFCVNVMEAPSVKIGTFYTPAYYQDFESGKFELDPLYQHPLHDNVV